ncbi:peptidylprolyl isomerase [Enterovirga sp.]|uniref:peptidylprolyl isomerase n=1 Tax=Enterovirga sp. TaxID=2026350 RepID=UPI002D104493|nr:peptidylprolyl isomerase [Enterovirga sp.]HMO29205.1 peptidylprolyl isomerase [Enterovirga sp.]
MASTLSRLSHAGILALALAGAGAAAAQAPKAPAQPAAPAAAPSPDTVIARVDGEPITEGDLAIASEDPALALPNTEPAQKRDILIGYLIDLKLGAKAAEAAKLGDTDAFKKRLAYLRTKLLVDEYIDGQTKAAVTPEAARKLYEETLKDMKPEEEIHARHILVDSEELAKKAAARVRAGEDFAKVAGELSKDPGSKKDGGDLGFFTKDRMVAPFAEAAFKLKPNEISEPVKSQFGWHVIQVLERRSKPLPTFEEMQEQIDQYLTRKAQQDAVLALRKTGKVERLDKPAEAPKPAKP